jgi:hypothetical protein
MEDRSKEIIQERVKKYSKAICKNIDDRFPTDSGDLGIFFVFDVTQVTSALQISKCMDNPKSLQSRSTFTRNNK